MLIQEQIQEYIGYKYLRHPYLAGIHRALLIRLADEMQLHSVKDLTMDKISFFIGEQLTGFYSMQAVKAIRQFLWFCEKSGYNCLNYREVTEANMSKPGPEPDYEMVEQVHQLREGKLSYTKVAEQLKGKYPERRIHVNSVVRWAKYPIKSPFQFGK